MVEDLQSTLGLLHQLAELAPEDADESGISLPRLVRISCHAGALAPASIPHNSVLHCFMWI